MSKATKRWSVPLDGTVRSVELQHEPSLGFARVRVDGAQVGKWFRLGLSRESSHAFAVVGHQGVVRIRGYLSFEYELFLNGYSTETGAPLATLESLPRWGYAFLGVCLLIPVVSMGGAIPAIIGFGAAAACGSVLRNGAWSAASRVLSASAISAVAWMAFLVIIRALR